MKIMRRQVDHVAILDIQGDVVGSWVRKLQNQIENLKETGTNKIILNMKEVNSIDSFGISVVLTAIKEGLVRIRFSNVGYRVREMLDRACIEGIYDTEEEALESLEGTAGHVEVWGVGLSSHSGRVPQSLLRPRALARAGSALKN